jgi:hypothetical protein
MNFALMLMRELAEMNMAILLMIVNTQDMLTVQKPTFSALVRNLYLLHNSSFSVKREQKSRKG